MTLSKAAATKVMDTLRSLRPCLALPLLPLLFACTLHYDAPRSPDRVLPANLELPRNAPAPGFGRAIIDVEGESATVERVIDSAETVAADGALLGGKARTEMLCMTPCAVDMRRGAHILWLKSPKDETRSSVALINISSSDRPVAVRHALGRSKGRSSAYIGGALLFFVGALSSFIGLSTAVGGLAQTDKYGTRFVPFSLALVGVGLATGLPGLWLLMTNRAVHQAGATTMWQP